MTTTTIVPLSEYLETTYRPDCDWLDGELRERSVGEGPHAVVQKFLAMFLGTHEEKWGILVLTEQRVQVSAKRFRIPDVCVLREGQPFEAIVSIPPLLCVEILSRDDTEAEMMVRAEDYRRMGVKTTWIIDPQRRMALIVNEAGVAHAVEAELSVPDTNIRLTLQDLFKQLNKLEGPLDEVKR